MSLYLPNQAQYLYKNEYYDNALTYIDGKAGELNNKTTAGKNLLPITIEDHLFHDISFTLPSLDDNLLYYLSFDVGQLYLPEGKSNASGVYASDTQNFTVKLMNSNGGETEEDGYQNLKNFSLKVANKNETVQCELLFYPNGIYDRLVFSLTRVLLLNGGDIGLEWPAEGALGRRMSISNIVLKQVNNLVGTNTGIRQPIGQCKLTAPAGTLFSLDREEIRVGKTGVYIFDIPNWNKFTYFGLVPPSEELEPNAIKLDYEPR